MIDSTDSYNLEIEEYSEMIERENRQRRIWAIVSCFFCFSAGFFLGILISGI